MNLDDLQAFSEIDRQRMIDHITGLPAQLQTAWDLGMKLQLPHIDGIEQVLIAGMGGSAIGADLLSAYVAPHCRVPVFVQRDYDLPAWAQGSKTLVIASSHSGNTEETLSAFSQAVERGCQRLVISTGGKLSQAARNSDTPVWRFNHQGQPRAAVGYSFGLLLAAFKRLNFIPDPTEELKDTYAAMQTQQERLLPNVPAIENPAKRFAGQFVDRWVIIMGADLLAPVARRWKGQISEVAKAWGQFEALPEANHNTLAGILNPEKQLTHTMVIFLQAANNHPRNRQRLNITRQAFMLAGLGNDSYQAQGKSRLAQLWTTLHFGDFTAYYLAMAYQVDPTPVSAIESFKQEMERTAQA